ncbi:MAG: putative lipid II flippase FtsW [Firmicutes bacterium]|jgi:cell division protein FtsW|nr:putative lipid II flippase FtsW [Bacillota bacterium]
MKKKGSFDYILFISVILLVLIGITMVFSSSYYYSMVKWNDKYYFFRRNTIMCIIGFIAMMSSTFIFRIKMYKRLSGVILLGSIVLLALVLTPLGTTYNNSTRWLKFMGYTFMPSEVAKLGMICFISASVSNNTKKLKNLISGLGPYLVVTGIVCGLILLEPDMSTSVTIAGIVFAILYVAGMRYSHLALFGILGSGLLYVLINSSDYRYARWISFMDPFKYKLTFGWQIIQSLYAFGAGGLFGVGLGQSTQNKLYISEPQNDFILATIGEEFGFIGTLFVMMLFFIVIWRGIKIAMDSEDMFSTLMATGITAQIAIQVIINVGVATSALPVTGIPLPFISYGGTATIITMFSMGILLNISRNNHKELN